MSYPQGPLGLTPGPVSVTPETHWNAPQARLWLHCNNSMPRAAAAACTCTPADTALGRSALPAHSTARCACCRPGRLQKHTAAARGRSAEATHNTTHVRSGACCARQANILYCSQPTAVALQPAVGVVRLAVRHGCLPSLHALPLWVSSPRGKRRGRMLFAWRHLNGGGALSSEHLRNTAAHLKVGGAGPAARIAARALPSHTARLVAHLDPCFA